MVSISMEEMEEYFPCPTLLPIDTVTCVIDLSHSGRYKMESQTSFDLHFPDG